MTNRLFMLPFQTVTIKSCHVIILLTHTRNPEPVFPPGQPSFCTVKGSYLNKRVAQGVSISTIYLLFLGR
jgi:hypothetical protein